MLYAGRKRQLLARREPRTSIFGRPEGHEPHELCLPGEHSCRIGWKDHPGLPERSSGNVPRQQDSQGAVRIDQTLLNRRETAQLTTSSQELTDVP